ncbi:MAG: monothiol bacilliredoxin BrxC family protein [Planctomycetota bacterium]
MESIRPLQEKRLPDVCYVFKHSTKCPVSLRAADRVKGESWSRPLYWINVIEQRELSNWVAEKFGVKHESPQLILVENGAAERVWNHGKITQAKGLDPFTLFGDLNTS